MKQLPVFILICFLLTSVIGRAQNNSKVIVDNAKIKVTECTIEPGEEVCGKGMHTHGPHLTVLLTEAVLQITLPDGKMINQKVPAGTTFWSDADNHAIVNTGKEKLRYQFIETK